MHLRNSMILAIKNLYFPRKLSDVLLENLFSFTYVLLSFQDKIFSENDRGSWPFLEALYNTADGCVECSLKKCQLSPEGSQKFLQFARSALFSPSGKPDSLVCAGNLNNWAKI